MTVIPDGSGPERESVVDAVLTASRVLVAIAARSLADVGDEVTLTQYRSLVVLASRGPQSVAALADELGVTPSTVSRLCDRLVRKRLVRRREDRRDRRAVRLALTPAARCWARFWTGSRRRPRGTGPTPRSRPFITTHAASACEWWWSSSSHRR
jgi:hypothetical protein